MTLYLHNIKVHGEALVGDLKDQHDAIVGKLGISDPAICAIFHKHGGAVAFTVAIGDEHVPKLPDKAAAALEPKANPEPATEPPADDKPKEKAKKGE